MSGTYHRLSRETVAITLKIIPNPNNENNDRNNIIRGNLFFSRYYC